MAPTLKKVAEKHDLLKNEQKYLISIYFAKQFLINSEMAKFYLEMGFQITKIYEFIEFFPKNVLLLRHCEFKNSRYCEFVTVGQYRQNENCHSFNQSAK